MTAMTRLRRGFTLIEVMIAIAFIGIALLALLSLHHSDLVSVIRSREMTTAAMLAQSLMAEAEMQRFPDQGTSNGDFQSMYPDRYPHFRWRRVVDQSPQFADVRRVRIYVQYGPELSRTFELTEFMHNPAPQVNLPSMPAGGDQSGANSPNVPLGGPGGAQ
jgi:general secretion pathway protein I